MSYRVRLTEAFLKENVSNLKMNPKRIELLKQILMTSVDQGQDYGWHESDINELESMLKDLGSDRGELELEPKPSFQVPYKVNKGNETY